MCATFNIGLQLLPAELLRLVASHSDTNTFLALAGLNRKARSVLGHQLRLVYLHKKTPKVKALLQFTEALEVAQKIPAKIINLPIFELGLRIPRLPETERQSAQDAWLKVARDLEPKSMELHYLCLAALYGVMNPLSAPKLAIQGGIDVVTVAEKFGVEMENIITLEEEAINGLAGLAVREGENVRAVAERFGIVGKSSLRKLEVEAINGLAGQAVREGENVQAVTERFGIVGKSSLYTLEFDAVNGLAGLAVREGENVQAVAERFGIVGKSSLRKLEVEAINGLAGQAVREGESVQAVAERFGIVGEATLHLLEMIVWCNQHR
ncbi:hypothetical protein EDB81DRAFT_306744 [Dactylonectria macrodidyma]|uniref:Uncharacterized protein n=1 Tax=Dactylonectria macrodidyma TaxID=307937 RepID=A0A9P9D717_9HYPO|nr:hypothetical protein EDB81DRAFT_306744 [Dactylonectria macrodidyma]